MIEWRQVQKKRTSNHPGWPWTMTMFTTFGAVMLNLARPEALCRNAQSVPLCTVYYVCTWRTHLVWIKKEKSLINCATPHKVERLLEKGGSQPHQLTCRQRVDMPFQVYFLAQPSFRAIIFKEKVDNRAYSTCFHQGRAKYVCPFFCYQLPCSIELKCIKVHPAPL